jgi:hypothetical protein
MAPRRKISLEVRPQSLNAVLSRQMHILNELLECNQELKEVMKAFKPVEKKSIKINY